MTKRWLFLLLIPFFFGCNPQQLHLGKKKLNVLVSIPPYHTFVKKIGGDEVVIETLLPVGADVHTYKPTPRDLEKLKKVDLWVRIGSPMEDKMAKTLASLNPDVMTLDLREKIPPLLISKNTSYLGSCDDGSDGQRDLHSWVSPRSAINQVRTIAQEMVKINPEKKDVYVTNINNYVQELEDLNAKITIQMNPLRSRALLVSHPSLGYFCNDYFLKQISIECEGKDPGLQDVDRLLSQIADESIICIITQPHFSTKAATVLNRKLNLPVTMFDPFDPEYIQNLTQLADFIAEHGHK